MKSRLKKKSIALTCLTLASLMTFSVAVTAAAFSIAEKHNQTITVDMGYAKYFGSGNYLGQAVTSGYLKQDGGRVYFINNAKHLRNLSTLVNIGTFKEKDEFILYPLTGNSITYDNIPLIPIGSEQFPFISWFHGADLDGNKTDNVFTSSSAPVLSNLLVLGTNASDIGMFGVIGNSASVENFILDKPVVKSTYNSSISPELSDGKYTFVKLDNNPLRDAINKDGTKLFTNSKLSSIKLTNLVNGGSKNLYLQSFKVDISSLGTLDYSLDEKTNLPSPINITYESSNTALLTVDATGSCAASATATAPIVNKRKKIGDYVTLTIKAEGLGKVGDSTRLCRMVIEKYKFYYNYANHGFINDPTDFKTYSKTIYPDVFTNKDIGDSDSSDKTFSYDNAKAIYFGIVAGRLEGFANRIGVHKPILDTNRSFISQSLLIGQAIDDDNKRTLSREDLIVDDVIDDNATTYRFKYIPNVMPGYRSGRGFTNSDVKIGNRMLNTIYDNVTTAQGSTVFTNAARNTIRIFGTNDNTSWLPDSRVGGKKSKLTNEVANENNATDGVKIGKVNINETQDNNTKTLVSHKVISISKPIQAQIQGLVDNSTINTFHKDDVGYKQALLSHAIQFWVSAKHENTKMNIYSNGNLEFYLDIEIKYLYFDDNFEDPSFTNNNMIVYASDKSLKKRNYYYPGSTNRKRYDALISYGAPRHLRNDSSYLNPDGTQTNTFPASFIPEIVAPHDAAPKSYKDNLTQVGNNYYYPFASMKPVEVDGVEMEPRTQTTIDKSKTAGATNVTQVDESKVQTMKFSIAANALYKPALIDRTDVQGVTTQVPHPKDRLSIGFFPIFWLGLDKPSTSNYRFDILSINSTMSNKKGNIDSSYGTVDYCQDTELSADLKLPFTSRGGFHSSGTKIAAKTIFDVNDGTNNNSSTAPAAGEHFAQTSFEALVSNKHCSYILQVNRGSDNKVHVKYKISNAQKTLSYILPMNTDGFKEADIAEGDSTLISSFA